MYVSKSEHRFLHLHSYAHGRSNKDWTSPRPLTQITDMLRQSISVSVTTRHDMLYKDVTARHLYGISMIRMHMKGGCALTLRHFHFLCD